MGDIQKRETGAGLDHILTFWRGNLITGCPHRLLHFPFRYSITAVFGRSFWFFLIIAQEEDTLMTF